MNELAVQRPSGQQSATAIAMASRAAQEVTAAMIAAKNFPRDEAASIEKIRAACKRPGLAEQAEYEFVRGKESVTGPSIRLAEVMAQCWGNVAFGVEEVERKGDVSTARAYCHDLESNTRSEKLFQVKHVLDTKNGPKPLKSERDIYELVANYGARRVRNCILAVIPGDVQDLALDECKRTASSGKGSLEEQIAKMAQAFSETFGVTREQIEARYSRKLESLSQLQVTQLRRIFASLRDEIATVAEAFPPIDSSKAATEKPKTVADLAKSKAKHEPAVEATEKPTSPKWESDLDILAERLARCEDENTFFSIEEAWAKKWPDPEYQQLAGKMLRDAWDAMERKQR